jgi:hypothetical protein
LDEINIYNLLSIDRSLANTLTQAFAKEKTTTSTMKSFLLTGNSIQRNLVRSRYQAVAAAQSLGHTRFFGMSRFFGSKYLSLTVSAIQKVPTMGDSISEGVV